MMQVDEGFYPGPDYGRQTISQLLRLGCAHVLVQQRSQHDLTANEVDGG